MARKPVAAAETSGETVTVACKIPNGLILRVFRMIENMEPVLGGGHRAAKVAEQIGAPVAIHGSRVAVGEVPKCKIVAGYALTPGVSKEFFELWLEQNADSELVSNNLVFAHESLDSAEDEARDYAKQRSGLEPLAMKGNRLDDPRIPKGRVAIQTADEQPNS
jgi:hypothetical protein